MPARVAAIDLWELGPTMTTARHAGDPDELEQALLERAKERTALYRVSRALAEEHVQPKALSRVAEALLEGVQWPEVAVAAVTIDERFVVHPYGLPAPVALLRAPILVDGKERGEVRVGYTEQRPFLAEEQQMLEEAATVIALWLARRDAVTAARDREAFLESLLSQVPGTIWTTDRDLRFLTSRGAAMVRHDLEEAGVVGRSLEDVVAELSPGSLAVEAHREALAGRSSSYRYEIDDAVWQAYVQPLRTPDGDIVGVIGSSIDVTDAERQVTELHEAQRELRESEERFRRLAEHAPDIIFRMTGEPDSRFEYISPSVETILGYTVEEVYADPNLLIRVLPPAEREVVQSARRGNRPLEPLELPMRHRDGHTVWLEVRLAPVTDETGHVVAVEGIARDISDGKAAEDALRKALAREIQAVENLHELDRMKNGFLQAVSHELRTPLTSVVGFSALLKHPEKLTEERYATLVTRLNANALRLERLLTDLLDVDRMTRGALEPNREPTNVFDLVGRVAEDLVAEGNLVRVEGDPLVAEIDGPKTERIVENLIRNAVRHAPGDAPIDVTIEWVEEGVLLSVADRGPGVPDDLKQALFEPFRQGNTDAAKVGGLGVGLTVVETFARLHGGRAWVEDRDGGGAIFQVLLPAPTSARGAQDAAAGTTP